MNMDSRDNFKNNNFYQSLSSALDGYKQAFLTERNLRFHSFAACLVMVLAALLKFTFVKWLFLIVAMGFVFVAELFNSAIEAVVDLACDYEWHPLAKRAKDISAAAVMISALIAIAIGIILFLPLVWQIIIERF
ncbi:diacylglycerol kinase family protein [Facklamia sp. DSM 111018]|uniref:Diacylglycerol kinase family protein n=1 Tax=Facklamia lactis TaxID=2749967 RepID=A0ABS0LP25_9LACT|nr:diacylglycerol kinase family protein [Facklamia lactis]MBG9980101.1 diacylglycerol kinase family protein [Facklamia lactis]MBG9985903.1 diacylglycerol kinase family protein [Facklamia lactis]